MIYPIKKITAQWIAEKTHGRLIYGSKETEVTSISTDSRTIDSGTLFIPLKGENFNGHDFICDVCDKGASGYICSDGQINDSGVFAVMVDDTKKAFLDLASAYRLLFDIPVVGLTGSVGKTTTKDFIFSVLSKKYETVSTKGNFNNEIGLPLTIFSLNDSSEAAVTEMGMSNFGEIEKLSKCARPDIALITNIGTSHIEFLKSQDGILKAKSEIFKGLRPGGCAILNGDDAYLRKLKGKLNFETIYIGIENDDCDISAKDIVSDENGSLFKADGKEYRINLPGVHNIYNALFAVAVGRKLDISYEKIYSGLKSYYPGGLRQNIISSKGYKVINDCYNSSPQSVKASLNVLDTLSAKRRIAVLGNMAELGHESEKLHRCVGTYVSQSKCDILITVGDDAELISKEAKGIKSFCFHNNGDASEFLKKNIMPGDAVLIKASRCMKFEEISDSVIK